MHIFLQGNFVNVSRKIVGENLKVPLWCSSNFSGMNDGDIIMKRVCGWISIPLREKGIQHQLLPFIFLAQKLKTLENAIYLSGEKSSRIEVSCSDKAKTCSFLKKFVKQATEQLNLHNNWISLHISCSFHSIKNQFFLFVFNLIPPLLRRRDESTSLLSERRPRAEVEWGRVFRVKWESSRNNSQLQVMAWETKSESSESLRSVWQNVDGTRKQTQWRSWEWKDLFWHQRKEEKFLQRSGIIICCVVIHSVFCCKQRGFLPKERYLSHQIDPFSSAPAAPSVCQLNFQYISSPFNFPFSLRLTTNATVIIISQLGTGVDVITTATETEHQQMRFLDFDSSSFTLESTPNSARWCEKRWETSRIENSKFPLPQQQLKPPSKISKRLSKNIQKFPPPHSRDSSSFSCYLMVDHVSLQTITRLNATHAKMVRRRRDCEVGKAVSKTERFNE